MILTFQRSDLDFVTESGSFSLRMASLRSASDSNFCKVCHGTLASSRERIIKSSLLRKTLVSLFTDVDTKSGMTVEGRPTSQANKANIRYTQMPSNHEALPNVP